MGFVDTLGHDPHAFFFNFHSLTTILETCFMIVNDFYKIKHSYYFLHANYFLTKTLQTRHSEIKNKIIGETGSNQNFEI